MSVTFYPELTEDEQATFSLECADGVQRERRTGSYEFLTGLVEVHQFTCEAEDCRTYGPSVAPAAQVPEVNVSNVNAAALLDALGITARAVEQAGVGPFAQGEEFIDNCVGQLAAEDFLGRVLLASGLAPVDGGRPRVESRLPGGGRFIDMGRREGYLQERLAQLEEVARWAIAHDRIVVWG